MSELAIDTADAHLDPKEIVAYQALLDRALRALDAAPEGDFLRVTRNAALLKEIQAFRRTLPIAPPPSGRCAP